MDAYRLKLLDQLSLNCQKFAINNTPDFGAMERDDKKTIFNKSTELAKVIFSRTYPTIATIVLIMFIPFICHAQTKVELQDSVTKYQDISNFIYDEYWGSSFADVKAGPYNDKIKYYQNKIDKITDREQVIQDSIQFSDRRKYLETKYKIKLP